MWVERSVRLEAVFGGIGELVVTTGRFESQDTRGETPAP